MRIKDYYKRSDKRELDNEKMITDFVKWLDTVIVDKLNADLSKVKDRGKIPLSVVDQLFKADQWSKFDTQFKKGKRSLMTDLLKSYRNDIDDLKKVYGELDFQNSNITNNLKPLSMMLDDEIAKHLLLKDPLESEVRAMRLAYTASHYTDQVDKLSSFLESNIKPSRYVLTEFNTATNNLHQALRYKFYDQVESDSKKFYYYYGVLDSRTRDFCRRYVGKKKTEKEWKSIQNQHGGSVWYTRGGYNCRHMLVLDMGVEDE